MGQSSDFDISSTILQLVAFRLPWPHLLKTNPWEISTVSFRHWHDQPRVKIQVFLGQLEIIGSDDPPMLNALEPTVLHRVPLSVYGFTSWSLSLLLDCCFLTLTETPWRISVVLSNFICVRLLSWNIVFKLKATLCVCFSCPSAKLWLQRLKLLIMASAFEASHHGAWQTRCTSRMPCQYVRSSPGAKLHDLRIWPPSGDLVFWISTLHILNIAPLDSVQSSPAATSWTLASRISMTAAFLSFCAWSIGVSPQHSKRHGGWNLLGEECSHWLMLSKVVRWHCIHISLAHRSRTKKDFQTLMKKIKKVSIHTRSSFCTK